MPNQELKRQSAKEWAIAQDVVDAGHDYTLLDIEKVVRKFGGVFKAMEAYALSAAPDPPSTPGPDAAIGWFDPGWYVWRHLDESRSEYLHSTGEWKHSTYPHETGYYATKELAEAAIKLAQPSTPGTPEKLRKLKDWLGGWLIVERSEANAALSIAMDQLFDPEENGEVLELLGAQPGTPKPKWISVKERLPELGEWCLVVINGIVQRTLAKRRQLDGELVGWEWTDSDADCAPAEAVNYWQPIPEFFAPTGENKK